ncbi:glycosyltransferase [Psychromonas algicola]|uniref:glycosyltransferase n=1 Tax=Psychromonas algicola TaxID=2555642 RepID=UPI001067D06A|nr:glycosyltransferase [Psychromonas sp. RZ5]TEW51990.1 glycosyltransferase [Psychromonas sp. RZ5]
MQHKYKASLIIAVYKRVDFLELIFRSIEIQTFKNFEVIVAEDDNSIEVAEFIKRWKDKCSFDIKHISQEDDGFRKNKLLNKALAVSEGEHTVFIDGDCILHKDFMKDHITLARPNTCLFGRRVMLDEATANQIIETKDLSLLSFSKLLFTKSKHLECAIRLPFLISRRKSGMLGCNFSVLKETLIAINGFDEDFTRPLYGEDTDVARRLSLIGVNLKCSKFKTIQYHLHHAMKDRDNDWIVSGELYKKKVTEGKSFCENGYIKK